MAFPSHNSDSAFAQPQSSNTLNSPTSPASSTSAEEGNLLVQDQPHVGELHLVPCALDVYLDLPNKAEDRYELVEGILFHRPNMANSQHGIIKDRNGIRKCSKTLRSCSGNKRHLPIRRWLAQGCLFHIAEFISRTVLSNSALRSCSDGALHTLPCIDIKLSTFAL